jgi:rubrerythrin
MPGCTHPVEAESARKSLELFVRLLQKAYSGELAAALAYQGHWNAVKDPDERVRIRRIEQEEWTHRRIVGRMLYLLGAAPLSRGEVILAWETSCAGLPLSGMVSADVPRRTAGKEKY